MARLIKRKWYKFLFNPAVLITLFLFFYLIFLIRGDLVKYFELIGERRYMKESILSGEQQKQAYLKELEKLDEPGYIEELARTKLGLIKPGEKGYKVY